MGNDAKVLIICPRWIWLLQIHLATAIILSKTKMSVFSEMKTRHLFLCLFAEDEKEEKI